MKISIKDTILVRHDVGTALATLREYVQNNSMSGFISYLEQIEADFDLMCNYMLRGFKDPQGDAVYSNLLERTYRLFNNVRIASVVKKRPSFANAKKCAEGFDGRVDAIRSSLENFVQERAFGALLASEHNSDLKSSVSLAHQDYMNRLFCFIISSNQWSDGSSSRFAELMLSPTIEQNDAMLMLSAIMLALMNVFDREKWLTLFEVYKKTEIESIRQRALVGWVFGLPHDDVSSVFPRMKDELDGVLNDQRVRHELLELQMQIFYCSNAKADNEQIRKDIMPTLMRNSEIHMSHSKFVESEDDVLGDRLGNEDSEAQMERVEKTMSQMMDMQKSGIDIYYGGFSQMKRFHFFCQLSNWFYPYTPEHPELKDACRKIGNSKFLDNVLENGPFCDSDKYSFALAIASVIERLPQNVRDIIGGDTAFGQAIPAEQRSDAAFVRRSYLQDLFRFFNLSQYKSDFSNPFDVDNDNTFSFFFINQLFPLSAFREEFSGLMAFLYKRRLYSFAIKLYRQSPNGTYSVRDLCVLAYSFYHTGDLKQSKTLFDAALKKNPFEKSALRGIAKVCFVMKDYLQAESWYSKLVDLENNIQNQLNLATSKVCCGKVKEGMTVLFKLNYECPDNCDVKRALAWGYLMSRKPKDADNIYNDIMAGKNALDTDILNAAYAKWFLRNVKEAVSLFRHYLNIIHKKTLSHSLSSDFEEDIFLLETNDVAHSEQSIMLCLVNKATVS